MARMLPLEADSIAFTAGIPSFKASTKAASEEKGKMVAARNAVIKSANSATVSV